MKQKITSLEAFVFFSFVIVVGCFLVVRGTDGFGV